MAANVMSCTTEGQNGQMRKLTDLTCVLLRHGSLTCASPDKGNPENDGEKLLELRVGTPPKLNGTPWRRADSLASPRGSRLFGSAANSGHGRTRSLTLTDPTLRGSRSSVHQLFQERLKKPVAVHLKETLDVFFSLFDIESDRMFLGWYYSFETNEKAELLYTSFEITACTV